MYLMLDKTLAAKDITACFDLAVCTGESDEN